VVVIELVADVVLPEEVAVPEDALTVEPLDVVDDDNAIGVVPGGVVVSPTEKGLLIDAGVGPPLIAEEEPLARRA
jgi:hypothetical protein